MTRVHAKLICFLVLSLVTRLQQSFAEMRATDWHRYLEPEAMGAIMPPRSYFSLFTPLAASVCYDLHFFSKDSMTFILACGVLFSVSLRFWSFFFSITWRDFLHRFAVHFIWIVTCHAKKLYFLRFLSVSQLKQALCRIDDDFGLQNGLSLLRMWVRQASCEWACGPRGYFGIWDTWPNWKVPTHSYKLWGHWSSKINLQY